MKGFINNAGQQAALACTPGDYIPPSYLEQLRQQRDQFQARLDNINALIQKLESNPEFVDLIDLMNKV